MRQAAAHLERLSLALGAYHDPGGKWQPRPTSLKLPGSATSLPLPDGYGLTFIKRPEKRKRGQPAKRDVAPRYVERGEDLTVGFWISRAPFNVTYVRLSWRLAHDVLCDKGDPGFHPARVVSNATVIFHKLKRPSAMYYAWATLTGRSSHSVELCDRLVFNKSRPMPPKTKARLAKAAAPRALRRSVTQRSQSSG